jgi:thiamine biosynthesis lipoprotein
MKRRRFLRIAAAAGLVAASPARAFRLDPVEWRGVALGAPARMIIHHEDRAEAIRLVDACAAEIARLESIFSLYRADSALVRLNRAGHLSAPPLDLVVLMAAADKAWRDSGGAFDATVQPLWTLYAGHFRQPGAAPMGPPQAAIDAVLDTVGWQHVRFDAQSISFARPGMALTFNGIAQGYVTDRIAALLRGAGMRNVLVDMGEIAANGPHADGTAWRVGLPDGSGCDLRQGGLAVSSADGTRFSSHVHHIFDPRTGRSPAPFGAWTMVRAATAVEADARSTARLAGWGA